MDTLFYKISSPDSIVRLLLVALSTFHFRIITKVIYFKKEIVERNTFNISPILFCVARVTEVREDCRVKKEIQAER